MLKSNNIPSLKQYFIIAIVVLAGGCNTKNTDSSNTQSLNVIETASSSKVFFKNMQNGDTLVSPINLEMGVSNMIVKPAGPVQSGTGHHHVIIDGSFIKFGQIVPMDMQHLHYGKGDSVVEIALTPGLHTLTLQFANGMHMSYGEQFSNTINIYIK